jgi:autotransporter-associated beta strand protein
MQTRQTFKTAALFSALLCVGLASAKAASVTNADAAVNLNLGGSWVGGVPAGASDVAVWDHTVSVNTTKALGANLSWSGIQVFDPAALITVSAGNTLTLGASGIDMSAATNGLTLSCPVALGSAQNWNVTNGQTLTAGGVVSGAFALTLNNGGNNIGTNILGGANTYTGGTTLNSGIAQPNTINAFGTGTVTLNGGTMLLSGFPSSGVMVNAFSVPGTVFMDMFGRSVSMVFNGAWSGSGTIYVTNDTASGSTLTFGGVGNMSGFTGSIIVATNASTTASAGTLRFNNGGSQANTGNASMSVYLGTNSTIRLGNRDAGTTSIGELTGGPGTQVLGPTGAAGTENWSIGGKNTSVTFYGSFTNNAANEIAALTKVGTGTYTLAGVNWGGGLGLTGATTISAGVLQIGDGNADGTLLGGAVANNASLVFNRPDSYNVSNNISGGGSITILAGGTNNYYGTNSSSGATTISSGGLVLQGSALLSCPVVVGSAGTFDVSQVPTFTLNQSLSGSGVVNGLLTANGGSINPGGTGTSGTLTFLSGLTENGNINNTFSLSSPLNTNDLINVVGNLTLNNTNNIILSHFGGGTIPSGIYPLIAYSGTLTGGIGNLAVTAVGVTGTLTNITTTTPPEIAVIVSPTARGATNLTWKGDGVLNVWDTSTSNWVNGVTSFAFQAGDYVLFNDSGAPNTNVNLSVTALPGSVTVSNTQQYTISGTGSIGGGIGLTKTNSGILTMLATNTYTGPTIVGQGVLEVQTLGVSGQASGIGESTSSPTNLVLYGSTFKFSGPNTSTDHGVTLNGTGGIFDVTNGTTLALTGTITGPGSLTLIDSGTLSLANVNTYTGGTVLSNGVLALGSNNANNNGSGGSGVGATNEPVTFYGGTLQLYGYGLSSGNNYNTFYNPLVVPAGQTGTLIMFPRGQINTGGGAGLNSSLTGSGTLNLEVNYVRDALSGNWSAFTGQIIVTNANAGGGDEMRLNNTFGYSNCVIYLNGNVIMDSTLSANATITIGELGGTNNAVIGPGTSSQANPTWSVGWKNTTNTFAGTIKDDGKTSLTKVGTGTLYLSGQNTYSGATTISQGVLALTNNGAGTDGAITGSTNIIVTSGAFLDVTGRSDGTMPVGSGQTVSGNGTVRGILDNSGGGTIAPGSGLLGTPETLTVTGNINLGGTAQMGINRAASPNSDRLATSGTINYGGTLVVNNTGGPLQPGDTFTLFTAGTYTGSFSTLTLPDYYVWDTSQLAVTGKISVVSVSSGPTLSADFSNLAGGTVNVSAIHGAANAPYSILTSTNAALPVSMWSNALSGNFDGSGNLSTTGITVDPSLPQQFFIISSH